MIAVHQIQPRCGKIAVVAVVVSRIQRLVVNPKKVLYTLANPARGLLNREKRTKEKLWQRTPPPPPPTLLLVRRKYTQVSVHLASVQEFL